MTMSAKVVSIESKLFDGQVEKIIVPAIEGEMCLLPNHISIVTHMRAGTIKMFRPGIDRPISIDVTSGICSFFNNYAVFVI